VRLTTSNPKTLLLWNLNSGGQGPIWAVAPLDGLSQEGFSCTEYVAHTEEESVQGFGGNA
jgi:hypothetical protein